ncbi:hypothetical protein [Acidocella sp.]|jgi:hypothetical protein|uniref:hypothetical protein n=1 Tax=Acidocella sp. TaxID=50710 RepID=UPI002F410C32
MDDRILKAKIDDVTTLYVSPLDPQVFSENLDEDNLGGCDGYFVTKTIGFGRDQKFEILAKAPSFEAAEDIFDMITGSTSPRGRSNESKLKWY